MNDDEPPFQVTGDCPSRIVGPRFAERNDCTTYEVEDSFGVTGKQFSDCRKILRRICKRPSCKFMLRRRSKRVSRRHLVDCSLEIKFCQLL